MKIRPKGCELFLAEGRTDRRTGRYDEADSRFSQFRESASKLRRDKKNFKRQTRLMFRLKANTPLRRLNAAQTKIKHSILQLLNT
jgi:hypothetical protein